MRARSVIALILALILSSCSKATPVPMFTQTTATLKQQVVAYLGNTFPKEDYTSCLKDFVFEDSDVTETVSPTLNKYVPQYRFFQTTLMTGCYEYPNIETLVIIDTNKSEDVTIIKSPDFSSSDLIALEMFYGTQVHGDVDKRAFCREIAQLLANIIYKGDVLDYKELSPKSYSYKLVQRDSYWQIFTCEFNTSEQLDNISYSKPIRLR